MKVKNLDLKIFLHIWVLIFILISVYPLINGEGARYWSILIAILIFTVSVVNPMLLKNFYIKWIQIGEFIGAGISKVVLFIIYFGLFTPVAIVLRVLGKDLLNKKLDKTKNSYWVNRKIQPQSMKNQF